MGRCCRETLCPRAILALAVLLEVVRGDDTFTVEPMKLVEVNGGVPGLSFGPGFIAVAGNGAHPSLVYRGWQPQTRLSHDEAVSVQSIAAAPDGSVVLEGTASPPGVFVWDASTGGKLRYFEVPGTPTAMQVTPDGAQVVMCCQLNNPAYAFDVATGDLVGEYPTGSGCSGVALTADGAKLVVADATDVYVYDRIDMALETSFDSFTEGITDVAVTPDGARIVVGSGDGATRVFDTTGAVLHDFDNGAPVLQVEVTSDGSQVLFGGDGSGDVKVHSIETGEALGVYSSPEFTCVRVLDVSSDGTRVAASSCSPNTKLAVWVSPVPTHHKSRRASVRVAQGSGFYPVPLLPGEQEVEDGRIFVGGIPALLSEGAEATAWFPRSVGVGQQVEVSCRSGGGGCSVAVAVYHCPPCSSRRNGGYGSTLPRVQGLRPVECPTWFTVKDNAVAGWVDERHRMAAYVGTIPGGGVLTLPSTTAEATYFVVFTTLSRLPSNWCSALPAAPGEGKGASAASSSVGPACLSRFCL